jgi:chitosanase
MRLRQSAFAIGLLWGTSAVAQVLTSGPSADTLPPAWKSCADQMISVFENESTSLKYDYIENLHDGRGYTAGPYGFSIADGDLLQVVEVYGGMRPNNVLSGFIPILKEARETALIREVSSRGLESLPAAWKKAASDPRFRQAQDQVSDRLHYIPAMKAADDLHVLSPLAKFALYDAVIQHGMTSDDPDGLGAIIRAATRAAGGPPEQAGEENWLTAFLAARKKILLNATNPETRRAWKESWAAWMNSCGCSKKVTCSLPHRSSLILLALSSP